MRTTSCDITAIVNFHAEGIYAEAAIRSFERMCRCAQDQGLVVEKMAVLDRADALTTRIVQDASAVFDAIEFVDFGDLGDSRNHGVQRATGKYLALFDGDDMWGSSWLHRAHHEVSRSKKDVIAHPEWMYYFSDEDFSRTSLYEKPASGSRSFFMRHIGSKSSRFDVAAIMFNNVYSSNSFARRSLLLRFPYLKVDRMKGLGVEDWYWNAMTLRHGIEHLAVPESVHVIRVKSSASSLGVRNAASGLLPPLFNLYA